MSLSLPSYSSARSEAQNNNILTSEVDKIQAKLSDLSKDLEKFAPEYRSQVMVDRLRQQKLRAMISLAKAQHYLAETDVLIADYNLQAVAEEFEHMKKERYLNSTDMKPQNSGSKEEKLVSTDSPASSANHKDIICCTSFPPTVDKSKSKEISTECTPKLSTHLVDACILRSKTDAFTPILKNIQPINKIDGSETTSNVTKASYKSYEPTTSKTYKESSSKTKESSTSKSKESKHKEAITSKTKDTASKTKESTTSKTKEDTTSKTKEATTSKTKEATTSKTKEATTSKTKEDNTSKTKESTTSKTKEDTTSKTKEATTSKTKEDNTSKTKESTTSKTKEADIDLPAIGRKSKKRKRSRSKSKESKKHKSSHRHEKSSHATVTASNASAESTVASSNVNTASLEPVASSNMNTALLGSAASSIIHTAFTRALASTSYVPVASTFVPAASSFMPAASSFVPAASSFVPAATSYVPDRDYLKSNRTNKEKTLLNTSISPIKKFVEAKGVQTDKKVSKNDVVQTDVVQTLTKGVQTDNVIILQIGSDTVRVLPPDIADEDTLLLDTLPTQHSHSAAISLAKVLQEINSQKSPAPIRLCPTEPDISRVLSQNEVLQKVEVIVEDEADAVEENPVAVKMEVPDGDFPNTSTEILVNNLYKDIMKEKVQKTSNMEPKGNVTKRELWKILDEC